jgi:hypothetical protein
MLFSLKELTSRLSPSQTDHLHVMKTSAFTLHHFQSLTGFVFVLNTKPEVPGMAFFFFKNLKTCIYIYVFFN